MAGAAPATLRPGLKVIGRKPNQCDANPTRNTPRKVARALPSRVQYSKKSHDISSQHSTCTLGDSESWRSEVHHQLFFRRVLRIPAGSRAQRGGSRVTCGTPGARPGAGAVGRWAGGSGGHRLVPRARPLGPGWDVAGSRSGAARAPRAGRCGTGQSAGNTVTMGHICGPWPRVAPCCRAANSHCPVVGSAATPRPPVLLPLAHPPPLRPPPSPLHVDAQQ